MLKDRIQSPKAMEFLCKIHLEIGKDGIIYGYPLNFMNGNTAEIIVSNGYFISPIGQDVFEKDSIIEVEVLGELE